MKTLKQLLDQVNGEIGFDIPSSYIGNQDPNIYQLVALTNRAAILIRDIKPQFLIKQATISMATPARVDATDNRISYYQLPSDFYSLVPDTVYQFGRVDPANLPTTPATWAYLRSRSGPSTLRIYCRIEDGLLAVFSPDATQHVDFEYIGTSPVANVTVNPIVPRFTDTSFSGQFLSDIDVWLLDDALIELRVKYLYCRAKGIEDWQEYAREYQTYENEFRARDGGSQTIYWPEAYPYPGEPYANLWVQ